MRNSVVSESHFRKYISGDSIDIKRTFFNHPGSLVELKDE